MPLDAKRILIPINDTQHSRHAFRWACHMARNAKAELLALNVIEIPLTMSLEAEVTEDIEQTEKLLREYELIARQERNPKLKVRSVRARQAGAAVAKEAEIEQVDLVILGIPSNPNLGQYPLGRTGSYIFRHTSCEVLLWRETVSPSNQARN